MKKLLISLIILGICFALGLGVRNLKDYYDDKKLWQDALAINTATSYRNYLQTHPQGRWRTAASQQIETLYDLTARRYIESRGSGFDPQASDAILQALNYAKRTQHYDVIVAFERQKNVDTLADDKLELYERTTFDEIKFKFEQIIPNDILNFTRKVSPEQSGFLIKYRVDAAKANYVDNRDLDIGFLSPTTYHGMSINWEFGIQIPSSGNTYKFNLKTEPDKKVGFWPKPSVPKYDYDRDKAAFLESVAENSFYKFRRDLITRLGLLR
jgi:hypothetical protein